MEVFNSTVGLWLIFQVFEIPGTASVNTARNIDFGVISVVSRYPGTVMGGTRVRIVNFAGNRELAILPVAENCVVKDNLTISKARIRYRSPAVSWQFVFSCRRSM